MLFRKERPVSRFQPNPAGGQDRRTVILRARDALRRGDLLTATETLAPLISTKRPDAEALYLAGLVAERQLNHVDAERFARRSIAIREHPDALRLLASSLRSIGDLEACLKVCDRLIKMAPDPLSGLAIKAETLQERRRFDEAEKALAEIDALCNARQIPVPGPVRLTRMRLLLQQGHNQDAVAHADEMLKDPHIPPAGQRQVHFERAKALDRLGRYPEAFQAASAANSINEPMYDPVAHAEGVRTLIEQWSKERLATFPQSRCMSEVPVFIAGMPRSGTSLVDQIIDAHPHAAGVGELQSLLRFGAELGRSYDPTKEPPDCFGAFGDARWTQAAEAYHKEIKREAPKAKRIVNKALGNDMILGLVARLFPRTKIIHVRRDPRDVAISCFMGSFNTQTYPWTARIEWAAHAWSLSEQLMDHWKDVLDPPILELSYERLVHAPREEIPRILEFLDLPPDEACYAFHTRERKVRTLSFDQVTRPMYTSSAGRHANYADQIAGVQFPAYP